MRKSASIYLVILLSYLLTLSSVALTAQNGSETEAADDTIKLFGKEVLGEFNRTISSNNEEAQAYFNQGIQLKYSFAVKDAAKSFRQAQKRDSTCAICYWGEAWALGSYLNGALSEDNAPIAYEKQQKAMELAAQFASPVERALIEATEVRFVKEYDKEKRKVQDSLYAASMKHVYEKYPMDSDIATIYAEALFLLEPRRGTREMDDPDVIRLHRVLEGVLDVDIRHPGACHLYIHATESTSQPELGAECAQYLGNTIPGASHMNHMPSHTYNEIGRWGESVKANLQAWHSDQKAAYGEGIAIYAFHNLHMLLYAACYDGQGAIAIQAAKDFARMNDNNMFQVLALIRFGRFEEVLELSNRPEKAVPGGMWDFAQGYARLKQDEMDFAKVYLNRVLTTADTSEAKYRGHPAAHILGSLGGILEGEIHWKEGDLPTAIQCFERAVGIEDSMMYDEPEPIPFDARHWLGAALMEAQEYSKAEEVYRTELADHPNNGWSYFGLWKALEAQGKPVEEAKRKFEECWARSDIWLRTSKF